MAGGANSGGGGGGDASIGPRALETLGTPLAYTIYSLLQYFIIILISFNIRPEGAILIKTGLILFILC